MQHYWIDSTPKSRRNDHIWLRKKCCFFRTIHTLTKVQLQWQNCMNLSTNCFAIHQTMLWLLGLLPVSEFEKMAHW